MATLANLLANLEAASGVQAAINSDPQPFGHNLADVWTSEFRYAVASGGVVNVNSHMAVVFGADPATGDAYWLRSLPEPLRVAVPPVYFSARTLSTITAAQIETFCNTQWETLHGNTDNILNFNVVPVSGNTVLVSGVFDQGGNPATWKEMEWYITLIDPNAANPTVGANVKFRQKV